MVVAIIVDGMYIVEGWVKNLIYINFLALFYLVIFPNIKHATRTFTICSKNIDTLSNFYQGGQDMFHEMSFID